MTTEEAIITRENKLQITLAYDDSRKPELLESTGRKAAARRAIIAKYGHIKGQHMVGRAIARAYPTIWNGEG